MHMYKKKKASKTVAKVCVCSGDKDERLSKTKTKQLKFQQSFVLHFGKITSGFLVNFYSSKQCLEISSTEALK